MKNLTFLITIFALLNNNANAIDEDDPAYVKQLRQLKTEQQKNLENIKELCKLCETFPEPQNEISQWKRKFFLENILNPAQEKFGRSDHKINQLQWEKYAKEKEEHDRQFAEAINILEQNGYGPFDLDLD